MKYNGKNKILETTIEIHKFYFPNYVKFTWDDVKDDFIPFLEILKDKYNFFEDIKFVSEDQYYNFFDLEYKYDDVINDLEVIHTIGLI